MKKISLFILTIFAIFTATTIVHADSNQLNITGYITNTDIKNKTITISNGNKKDFVIDKVPTKYLAYDKTNGNLTVTATSIDDKLVFNSLQSDTTDDEATTQDSDNTNDIMFCIIAITAVLIIMGSCMI